jgi:quercetin dioxygenase-like cupin family protein
MGLKFHDTPRGVDMTGSGVIVRARGEGEKRWFYGGGLHTWKATAQETGGSLLFFEDHMGKGKMVPIHIRPDADEAFSVLEGEIILHGQGVEHRIQEGGFALALRGVPHAYMATIETRLLTLLTPGTAQAFLRHASELSTEERLDGPVDFDRVKAAAIEYGGVELLGPPPFVLAH